MESKTYQGFETWWNSFHMSLKMNLHILLFLMGLQLLVITVGGILFTPKAYMTLFKYLIVSIADMTFPSLPLLLKMAWKIALKNIFLIILSFGIYFLWPKAVSRFNERAKKQMEDKYIRGPMLVTVDEINRIMKEKVEQTYLPVGDTAMPVQAEIEHALVAGATRSGKTTAINPIVEHIRMRGNKAIIYDTKGDFISKFYNPARDYIFNPLDLRSLNWNLFNDLKTAMDIQAMSDSLIPPPSASNEDPFWRSAARAVYKGIMHDLYRSNRRRNKDIWDAVTAQTAEIAERLAGTKGGEAGYSYIQDASGKQAAGVIAVLMQFAHCFEYMTHMEGDFSVSKWIQDDVQDSFIFIANNPDVEDTLRPILSLFIDLLGRKIRSLPDLYTRRVFFVLDEFYTLHKLPSIAQLFTFGGGKGASLWIGTQGIGKLRQIYGHDAAMEILNACNTSFIFRSPDPETAKYFSQRIGDAEVKVARHSLSMGVESGRDGENITFDEKIKALVLPSEIQGLPRLNAYVMFPDYPVFKTEFKRKDYPIRHPSFILRGGLSLTEIHARQMELESTAEQIIAETTNVKTKVEREQNSEQDYSLEIENEII
ncbi:MAG: type IV secretion system DNA-binding domain-containing protein [Nitrospirota bacterium]